MNIKATTNYLIRDYQKSVAIYYLIVILVFALFGVTVQLGNSSTFQSNGGVEASSMVFLFILGLNSFKEPFFMLLQNGVSRRSMFICRMISMLVTSTFMAVLDRILINLSGLFNTQGDRYQVSGLYEEFFRGRGPKLNFLTRNVEGVLVAVSVYLVGMAIGYFITTAYYRMNKAGKIAVSVGVPIGIFVAIPLIDETIFRGRLTAAITRFLLATLGVGKGVPYYLIATSVCVIILVMGLSWLLMRKAVDKN